MLFHAAWLVLTCRLYCRMKSTVGKVLTLACFAFFFSLPVDTTAFAEIQKSDIKKSMIHIQNSGLYTELEEGPLFKIDLRYATTNNFTGVNLYGEFTKAFLHADAAKKLLIAAEEIKKMIPGHRIVVFDALRPRSVQWRLWEKVKNTPEEMYVADPNKGSIHNYGLAIDCSLVDKDGTELDMGTAFDFFGPLAQPKLETEMLRSGQLTSKQLNNRKILRTAMEKAGFIQLSHEWWHYDAVTRDQLKGAYQIVE